MAIMIKDDSQCIFEFGPYSLDVGERRLMSGDEQIPLTPKAFDLLLMLVENNGRVVEKNEIMGHLWPDSVVEEANLAQHIFTLRRELDKRVAGAKYIETVPKRGYRFIAEVKHSHQDKSSPATHVKSSPPSIAVLPFDSLLVEHDSDHLGLGMADTLITKFSRIKGIIIRPTTTVRRYSTIYADPVEAGKELGVDMVITGNLQKSGNKIRVSVQLIKVYNSAVIWSEKFDDSFNDIFTFQDSISEQIINVFAIMMAEREKELVTESYRAGSKTHLSHPTAHSYPDGKWTRERFEKGIAFFKQAVQIDPGFALAQAAVAEAYNTLSLYGYMAPKLAFHVVNQAALQAIQLDPMLAEAHAALAINNFAYSWDWATAEQEFSMAIELNSGNPLIYLSYASFLLAMGRFSEASNSMRIAQKLDPRSPLINTSLAYPSYFARQYDQALSQLYTAIEIDSYFPLPYKVLGDVFVEKGEYEKAIAYYQKNIELLGRHPANVAHLGRAYALSGEKAKAVEIIRELESFSKNNYLSPTSIAVIYAGLGESDRAFEYLEEAYRERCNNLVFINVQPTFDRLRSDPRFTNLIQRMGFVS
jgi:DNA-binding winged helix-turn-helix (wHTH) protein/tetratricopeptide (TPR) repeat protein